MIRRLIRSREFGILVILLVMALGLELRFRSLHGQTFFSLYNIERIASDFSFVALAAIGGAIVILTGGIDLSSGSMMALGATGIAFAYVTLGLSPLVALTLVLLVGFLLGGANGVLHAKVGLPPFIATLGMLWIARGLAFTLAPLSLTITWDSESANSPWLLETLGEGTIFYLIGVTVLTTLFMSLTRWGRYIYAIGGNEEASRFSGVPVNRVKIAVYALAGLFSALAGAALALSVGAAHSGTARGYELNIIAAAVVGGTSLSGGQGSIPGAALGALVLQLLRELLILYEVEDQYIQVVYGIAILAAVALDQLARRGTLRGIFRGIFRKGNL